MKKLSAILSLPAAALLFAATGLRAVEDDATELQPTATPPPVTSDGEPPAAATSTRQVTTEDIDAAYERFMRLRGEDRMEDATRAALTVAELTRERYGAGAIELATPLINLAVMQSLGGNLTAAEQNYRSAIAIIEREESALSPRLINPLSGLGHTYNRAGNYDEAIESFERALRLNNIEQGLLSTIRFSFFKIIYIRKDQPAQV